MFQVVGIVGPDYRGPSYNDSRGRLLDEEKVDCTQRLDELRQSWAATGCSIMSDGWTDGKGRSIINFLVNCPRGTILSNLSMHLPMLKMHTYYVICWISFSKR